MPHEYGDLLDVIGRVSMNGYCSRDYDKWEKRIATPALQRLGYTVIRWIDGERDSFGPLSRIVVVTNPDGNTERLIYG